MAKNKFCERSALRNESDVEQFFITPLLFDLGYKDVNILTKTTIPSYFIGKGNKKTLHKPDYALKIKKIWVSILEAKHPDENIEQYYQEAQDYATIINRGYIGIKPIKYCLVSNGLKTVLLKPDENKSVLELNFDDFVVGNEKFNKLKSIMGYAALSEIPKENEDQYFEFRKPEIDELKGIFQMTHDILRNTHDISPTTAFYEFTKLLFIKLNEDKYISTLQNPKKENFKFSTHYIESEESRFESPINELFKKYRDDLNDEVKKGLKKKIFEDNEILKPSADTIKQIVAMLENLDLKSVEDDINGKVFETFLSAVVRGKDLGQFFTPRPVVKFMVKMANLQITYDEKKEAYQPDKVLDGSCGSGGFLIFALSDLLEKAKSLPTDQKKINNKIKGECLFGIDKSEDKIVPIARMNMYIHGDGGNHIYQADTLDKDMLVPKGIAKYLQEERQELKGVMSDTKFDVVLTNPPFSMDYSTEHIDQKRILEQYEFAHPNEGSTKLRNSLSSNLMFLERYHALLEDGGKLLTVIDESVLNTEGQGAFMDWIRSKLREKYIFKAIISLPKNTFVNADADVKTSILYLTKKKDGESQPKVFYAISKNVGHNDSGKEIEGEDLTEILHEYQKFVKGEANGS